MPELWIAFIVLTGLALMLVVMPIFHYFKSNAGSVADAQCDDSGVNLADAKQANLRLFRDRLAELSKDMQDEKITQEAFAELKQELEKTLLNDIDTDTKASPRQFNKPRTVIVAVMSLLGIPLASVIMYDKLGSYQQLQQAQWTQETRASLAEAGSDTGDMLQRLEEKLVENPQHIEGWVLLGRSYLSMQRYPEASNAFEQLIKQLDDQGENPAPAYGLLAQSIYFANGVVTPGVQSAVGKALAADPNEGNALSLLGIASFQEQRYEDAIRYWQRILDANPKDPNVDALRTGVARAQQLIAERSASLRQTPSAEGSETGREQNTAEVDELNSAELQVRVTLPEHLLGKVEPSDTLFVLARPVGGRMPLAVTRRSAGELPLTVTLNDSMAMGPMAKLSSANQVEVIARISKSGTPQAQTGDIEGIAGPIIVQQQQDIVPLLLNKVLR